MDVLLAVIYFEFDGAIFIHYRFLHENAFGDVPFEVEFSPLMRTQRSRGPRALSHTFLDI